MYTVRDQDSVQQKEQTAPTSQHYVTSSNVQYLQSTIFIPKLVKSGSLIMSYVITAYKSV
jgi:hypothetical protein